MPDGTWISCWSNSLYGSLVSANITDLDQDGLPELILVTQFPGSGAIKSIMVLEWDGGGFEEREMPERAGMEGYMGHESVELGEGRLVVRYPFYLNTDANCCPSGGIVELVHAMRGDKMVVVERKRRGNANREMEPSTFAVAHPSPG